LRKRRAGKVCEKHGALFGRIQLIRKQSSAGGEHFARLEINQAATIKKLLLITSNPQLDDLFEGGFSDATFYKWRAKFGGMEATDAKRLKELESENAKLKKLLAEAHLDIHALKSVFGVKR
jgi:putative transposase